VVREVLETGALRDACPLPLTVSQFLLLKLMSLGGEHHVGEAASLLGISAAAATKNIDKLERLGLVARLPSSGDRRATPLSVSTKGRRLVERYENVKVRRLEAVLTALEDVEKNELARALERFSASLLGLRAPASGPCLLCAAYLERGCEIGRMRGGCPHETLLAASERLTNDDLAGGSRLPTGSRRAGRSRWAPRRRNAT
jgi:DNA-binding MarR family transcriptional regulator